MNSAPLTTAATFTATAIDAMRFQSARQDDAAAVEWLPTELPNDIGNLSSLCLKSFRFGNVSA
jgi:hypothetical protein